jgi:hypothetical protein
MSGSGADAREPLNKMLDGIRKDQGVTNVLATLPKF